MAGRVLLLAACLASRAAAASQPFCGSSTARSADVLVLRCAAGAGAIAALDFVAYGTPSGSCAGGDLARNASCDWAGAAAWAAAACVGKTECVLSADGRGVPDPCEGVIKTLAVVARCAAPPGGSALPVVPPCSTTQGTPPCPAPTWAPVWALNRSTICQPGANVGDAWLDETAAAKWGLVSLDWSIANGVWRGNGDVANMTGAATLVEQCRRIKAVDATTKCFVYRNTELALEWLEPQRAVMRDPAFAGYFLIAFAEGAAGSSSSVPAWTRPRSSRSSRARAARRTSTSSAAATCRRAPAPAPAPAARGRRAAAALAALTTGALRGASAKIPLQASYAFALAVFSRAFCSFFSSFFLRACARLLISQPSPSSSVA